MQVLLKTDFDQQRSSILLFYGKHIEIVITWMSNSAK
jgi:hypothetical protein